MTILNVAVRENSKVNSLGDFDIDILRRIENAQNLLHLSFGIEAKIHEPIRIILNSATCLDNFLTHFVSCESSLFEAPLSDHCG